MLDLPKAVTGVKSTVHSILYKENITQKSLIGNYVWVKAR